MNRIVIEKRVSGEGILQIELPLGEEQAGRDVRVTVEPIDTPEAATSSEWSSWVNSMAGSWQGDFERPAQGDYETRKPLS
jgi:hypothetical protein